MRAENLLHAAQQTITALTAQLRVAQDKLTSIEDLIGEVRTRLYTRGIETHPIVQRRRQLPGSTRTINSNATSCMFYHLQSSLFPELTHSAPATQP